MRRFWKAKFYGWRDWYVVTPFAAIQLMRYDICINAEYEHPILLLHLFPRWTTKNRNPWRYSRRFFDCELREFY